MSWETKTIKELCFLVTDGSHSSPREVEIGFPMASSKDMLENDFDYSNIKQVSEDDYLKLVKGNCKPLKDDILLIKDGNSYLKRIFAVKEDKNMVLLSSIAILRTNTEIINPIFFQYSLRNPVKKREMENYVSGAAIPRIVLKDFKGMNIKFPPLQTQKRIADILSAYDDLIENNLKRIKLLEQAAQNIYKEWFVNLRFPGHENTPIKEETGLPEGWTDRNINEVFNIKYGKNLPATKITSSGKYSVYGASGVMGYYEECNTEIKVALITSRGNGSGDVHRTFQKNSFVTNNSFKVFPKEGYEFYPFFFVTEFLKTLNLLNYCSGSAQPQLTNASMNNIRSIFPNKEMVDLFTQKVSPILEQSDVLLKQNQKLKAARDILLPRLMNRTIEV